MAQLTETSLLDCFYIPDFIASGTKMVFENATAPVSWTKDVDFNDYTLRIVNGTVGTGGTTAFTTVFSPNVSPRVSGTSVPATVTFPSPTSNSTRPPVQLGSSYVQQPFQPATVPTPPHTHPYQGYPTGNTLLGPVTATIKGGTTTSVGQNGAHDHGPYVSYLGVSLHSHSFSTPQIATHSHTFTLSNPAHNHTISVSPTDYSISYKDVIISTKD